MGEVNPNDAGDILTVTIQRVNREPIGLNITGGNELRWGGIYVHSVRPESLCDGKLKEDDELLSINNTKFTATSERSDAVKIVSTSTGPLHMTVKRQPYSGTLIKQGAERKNWKSRHFIVKSGILSYYHPGKYHKEKATPLGTVKLSTVTKIENFAHDGYRNHFGFQLVIPKFRTYYFFAETASDRTGWIDALKPHIHDPTRTQDDDSEEAEGSEGLEARAAVAAAENREEEDNDDDSDEEDPQGGMDPEVTQLDAVTDAAAALAVTDDAKANEGTLFEGSLLKSSPSFSNWTKRHFVIDATNDKYKLAYYKDKGGKLLNEIVITTQCNVKPTDDNDTRVKKGRAFAFVFHDASKSRDFICCTETEDERDRWVEAIQATISKA